MTQSLPLRQTRTVRYGAAFVISILAVIGGDLLAPVVGDAGQVLLSFPAVLVSAWFGGMGPGIFATVLCSAGAAWFIMPPQGSLAVDRWGDRIVLLLFMGLSWGLCALVERLHQFRRKAEMDREALHESQALFQDFMRHSPLLAFMRDAAGRIVYVNAAYERFYRASLADLEGGTLQAIVPEEVAVQLRSVYEQVLSTGEPREECFLIPTLEGPVHEWQFHLFRIINAAGERFLGGLALNITEQRTLEGQLRQAQKMDAIGRLAGGVAHDFNNMLAVISGYSELLLMQAEPGDPAYAPLTEVRKAADRAANLTRQLLAFSRQQVLTPQRLDLNDALHDISTMLRRLIGEDIELSVRCSAAPAVILADPGQIEQVLLNLAVNARDAMPQGGRLSLEVMARAQKAAGTPQVMLAVTDTGCGMDAATQARMFEPFFTTKEEGVGTGLGLATVHGIVKQTGGDIRVESQPGHGTSFKLYFPAAVEPEPEAAPAEVKPPTRGTETILLVEDEPMLRKLIRMTLEQRGYRILEAQNAAEAVGHAESYNDRIDLLLTDVVMPNGSGRDVAAQIVQRRPETRVVYMSGYTDDAVLRHGVLLAEVHFIQKPFTPEGLARKLREVLGHS